jgi:hypothetical protein
VRHRIASGVPSEATADFAANPADAPSAGEVRFGAATVFAQGSEDAFVILPAGGE